MYWCLKLILHVTLYATMIFVPAVTDCEEEVHYVNYEVNELVTWPASPSSDLWIASDCLDRDKLLLFRRCVDDKWIPSKSAIENSCIYKMNTKVSICPFEYMEMEIQGQTPRKFCISYQNYINSNTMCTKESVSFMELNIKEKTQLIDILAQEEPQVFMLGARYMPNNVVSSIVKDENYIDIQDARCGRFGLPFRISNTSVPIHCADDACTNMCLSINVQPLSINITIEKCSEKLFTIFENTFLRQFGCPSGYHRVYYYSIYAAYPYSCFSIKMFPEPIPVDNIDKKNVVNSYCNGTIMPLLHHDDMFIFKELSEYMGLGNQNQCLFALEKDKEIVAINNLDWDGIDLSLIWPSNINWDKTMNYSRISNKSEISYLAVKANGQWTWAVDTVSCIACVAHVQSQTPELRLNYIFSERKLELEVINQDFLYKEKVTDLGFICFALVSDIYKVNLTVYPLADSNGKFLIDNVGMGKYWCSGHDVTGENSILCSSELLHAYGIVFVFQVIRKCDKNCVFSTKDLDDFVEIFRQNSEVVAVVEAPFVQLIKAESETQYAFIAHLILSLQDNEVIDDLDLTLMNLTSHQTETVLIYENLKNMLFKNESNEMNIESIRSTEFCLHESVSSVDTIIWRIAYIGETIILSSLCSTEENESGITRICSGDHIYGTFWENSNRVLECYTTVSESLLEVFLNFTHSNQTEEVIDNVKNIIQENIDALLPVDVFITSKIQQKITDVTFSDLKKTFLIYNSLLQIEENVLKTSASMNSTNILLEALDIILSRHIESSIIGSSEYLNEGNISIMLPFIEIFILEPVVSNVSGIAIYRPRNSSKSENDFTNYSRQYVNQYEGIDVLCDGVTEYNLVIGSYVPANVINNHSNLSIVLVVFFNDKLFQNSKERTAEKYLNANGKIMSMTILGSIDTAKLPNKIPIFFETKKANNLTCGYWSFTSINGWSGDGCNIRDIIDNNNFDQIAICECSHLTHFGCHIDISSYLDGIHRRALTVITVIGSSFSLFGTFGIFITATLFRSWRKKLSSKILIHFSLSITLEMFLMIFINIDDNLISHIMSSTTACVALGSILHYAILVMCCWMLIIAYFQFKRYVVVFNFRVSHLLLKSTLFGWGTPLLPVMIVLIVNHSSYLSEDDENPFCYPTGSALVYGVIAPIALIFVIDFLVFITVIISLQRGLNNSTCITESNRIRIRLSEVRLSVFLFFTLGLTWMFGFLAKIHDCYVVFTYLFCITATIQGLVLFLYFIVFDPHVRSLWIKFITKTICRE